MGILESKGCDAAIIVNESNIYYLTKFPRALGSYVVILRSGESNIVVPLLDYWRARDFIEAFNVVPYAPYTLPGIESEVSVKVRPLKEVLNNLISDKKRICSDSPSTLKLVAGIDSSINIANDILDLRAIKSADEIEFMRKALQITEEALWRVLESLIPGMREYEIAGMLEGTMRYLGADGYAFDTIVASGPNSAYPHAVPSKREVKLGDVVVIDLGAKYNGYCSDMTRTIVLGSASKEVKNVLNAVVEALNNAADIIHDGVKAEEVDRVARNTLSKYGLSKYFIHSTGHGVGIEVHEKPRLAQNSKDVLREGMVVTIEPGVYIHGRFGIRVENMVLVRKRRGEILNRKPLTYPGMS